MILESLAVANAAYATIRTALENGKEISSVSRQIMQFATAKQDIERSHKKKKNGLFGTRADDDIEEFFHLEEIKEKERQLKELFMLYGRFGCWEDYQRFCADARKKRAAEQKRHEEQMHNLVVGLCIAAAFIVAIASIVFIGWLIYADKQGII